jgi:DNA-directed RNA polymerase specialized sigma24 family protein
MKADEKEVASPDEISQAIAGLTAVELQRIQKFARFRMAALGRLSRGRDYEDLLDEAMAATLDGRRTWRKGSVSFENHLKAVMRSTSDNWATREDQREVVEAELYGVAQEEDEADDLLGAVKPTGAGQELHLIEQEAMEALEAAVSDDPVACEVLSAWQLGLKGQELKDTLGINEEQLRAGKKKIDRRAQALQPRFAAVARRKE